MFEYIGNLVGETLVSTSAAIAAPTTLSKEIFRANLN